MSSFINVNQRKVGRFQKTFVIAEAGINHNGDMKTAEKMIVEAKKAGVDSIKFQTYLTEKRVPKDSPIFGILKQCELSFKDQEKLSQVAKNEGMVFFSTPFDEESADFLASIHVPILKIASFDVVNLKLLRHVSTKKTPIIISRGMASEQEINTALDIFKKQNIPFALLHCVSSYPTKEEDANLNIISTLMEKYDAPIGYSDHTLDIVVPVLAVAKGACVIEKHFTLDRKMAGPDHALSVDPELLKKMMAEIRRVETILGSSEIRVLETEKPILQYRRPSN